MSHILVSACSGKASPCTVTSQQRHLLAVGLHCTKDEAFMHNTALYWFGHMDDQSLQKDCIYFSTANVFSLINDFISGFCHLFHNSRICSKQLIDVSIKCTKSDCNPYPCAILLQGA